MVRIGHKGRLDNSTSRISCFTRVNRIEDRHEVPRVVVEKKFKVAERIISIYYFCGSRSYGSSAEASTSPEQLLRLLPHQTEIHTIKFHWKSTFVTRFNYEWYTLILGVIALQDDTW
jgi:hypothetical protein